MLDSAPEQVTLRCNEPVTTSLGAVRAIDPSGERLNDGQPDRSNGGAVVTVRLADAGAQGSCAATLCSRQVWPLSSS